jgi:hypothetical protein
MMLFDFSAGGKMKVITAVTALFLMGLNQVQAKSLGYCPDLEGVYDCPKSNGTGLPETLYISQKFENGGLVYHFGIFDAIADGAPREVGSNEENRGIVSFDCEDGTLVESLSPKLAPMHAELIIYALDPHSSHDLSIRYGRLNNGKRDDYADLDVCNRKLQIN